MNRSANPQHDETITAPQENRTNTPASIRSIRESRKISQRELARKMNVPRGYLARLESKGLDNLSLNEIRLLAGVLNLRMEDLVHGYINQYREKEVISRCSIEKPFHFFNSLKGVHVSGFLKEQKDFFAGRLVIDPKQTFQKQRIDKDSLLFCLVIEGNLLLEVASKEYLFKEGDCFSISEQTDMSFHNPHQVYKVTSFICSLSAFLN